MVKSILFNGRMARLGWINDEKNVRECRFLCCSTAAVFWIAKRRCMDFFMFFGGAEGSKCVLF